MATAGPGLGIDFGTSNTVAVLRWPDGRTRPLLFDGVPLLPSAVFVDATGQILVGREAAHAARTRPEAYEPNPKRRIDDGTVLLGDRELTIEELFAAVLGRVQAEATRVAPGITETTLTCPAAWGPRRRRVLVDAARLAGIPAPLLADEPVAAASYFAHVHGSRLPVGPLAVVYDFGAGTFDASVVRRTAGGFDVLASEGLPDAGGLDVDAAIVAYFGALYGTRAADAWRRLERPQTSADRRAHRMLWDDVRGAKESLSRTSATFVPIPLLDDDAPLGREQLERLSRPILDRTVGATVAALRSANAGARDIAEVYLVGGSSRMPLVATLLHQALGIAPTAIEQPEMVVAEGSLYTSAAAPVAGTSAAGASVAGTDGAGRPARGVATVAAAPLPPMPQSPTSGPPGQISGPPAQISSPPGPISSPPDQTWPRPEPAWPPPEQTWPPDDSPTDERLPGANWPPTDETWPPPPGTPPPSAPASPGPAPAAPVSASPAAQPGAAPAPPVPSAQPGAAASPAARPDQPAQPDYRRWVFAGGGVAALVVFLLIANSDYGPGLLAFGMRAPLVHPALALLPAAVALLIASRADVVRRAAELVLGYAAGLTLALPLASDSGEQALVIVRMVLGSAVGMVFIAAGILIAARSGSSRRRRFAAPLAGAGFAWAALPYTNLGTDVVDDVLGLFEYFDPIDALGLYMAYLMGLAVSVGTGTLAVLLVRGGQPRGNARAGGVLLALGGAFVAYAAVFGLLYVTGAPVLDSVNLAGLRGADTYSALNEFITMTAFPWLVGVAFVVLLVVVLVRRRKPPA